MFISSHVPKGRPEGSPIDDYVVEDHADHVLATFKRQREAIEWAKKNGDTVARVRHLNDKKKADHWRAAESACGRFTMKCDERALVRRADRRSALRGSEKFL